MLNCSVTLKLILGSRKKQNFAEVSKRRSPENLPNIDSKNFCDVEQVCKTALQEWVRFSTKVLLTKIETIQEKIQKTISKSMHDLLIMFLCIVCHKTEMEWRNIYIHSQLNILLRIIKQSNRLEDSFVISNLFSISFGLLNKLIFYLIHGITSNHYVLFNLKFYFG